MKITLEDGTEWETIDIRQPDRGEWFLHSTGPKLAAGELAQYLIIQPIRKEHEFSGVVFEETGEVRKAEIGDWVLSSEGDVICITGLAGGKYTILKPVKIV